MNPPPPNINPQFQSQELKKYLLEKQGKGPLFAFLLTSAIVFLALLVSVLKPHRLYKALLGKIYNITITIGNFPYKLHHSSKESYPEKYFNELFVKENINGFERDYYVNGYYLDYAFVAKKVDFEVDGSQHYVDPKIVEHDKVRTQYLESLGWKTFRIDWRVWQKMSDNQKHKKIEELKKLILIHSS